MLAGTLLCMSHSTQLACWAHLLPVRPICWFILFNIYIFSYKQCPVHIAPVDNAQEKVLLEEVCLNKLKGCNLL